MPSGRNHHLFNMSLVAKSARNISNKISKTDKHSINSVKRGIRRHFRGIKELSEIFTRRNILKTAAAAGIFAVLFPLLSNAASLGDTLNKNQKGVYPKLLDYNFVTEDDTPKNGYSEWDRNRMEDENLPPGIWEMFNRKGSNEVVGLYRKYKNGDMDWIVSQAEGINETVQMREPGFWLVSYLIDREFQGADMHYVLNDLQKNKRFDKLSPSVYNFARGFEKFAVMWTKNRDGDIRGGDFEDCKKAELYFLKGLFTSFKYEDKIDDYDKLGYYEKRVKEKEIGEKLAKEYQSKDIEGREAMIQNIIIPKINELGNSGDDYMRKLWASWNITMNVINYDYTYYYSEENSKREDYGDKNGDLLWKSLEKKITPKKGDYILPQVRGSPFYYNSDKYF